VSGIWLVGGGQVVLKRGVPELIDGADRAQQADAVTVVQD
jgi:hypothetical protein